MVVSRAWARLVKVQDVGSRLEAALKSGSSQMPMPGQELSLCYQSEMTPEHNWVWRRLPKKKKKQTNSKLV